MLPRKRSETLEFVSEEQQVASPNNCAIRERTAEGVSVGRCWFYLKDGICPRHGDVKTPAQKNASRPA